MAYIIQFPELPAYLVAEGRAIAEEPSCHPDHRLAFFRAMAVLGASWHSDHARFVMKWDVTGDDIEFEILDLPDEFTVRVYHPGGTEPHDFTEVTPREIVRALVGKYGQARRTWAGTVDKFIKDLRDSANVDVERGCDGEAVTYELYSDGGEFLGQLAIYESPESDTLSVRINHRVFVDKNEVDRIDEILRGSAIGKLLKPDSE